MTTRRGFLGSILALGVAPAIVRADSLMRIVPRETTILSAVDHRMLPPGTVTYLDGMFFMAQPGMLLMSNDSAIWTPAKW
jgi:hypothetical protein